MVWQAVASLSGALPGKYRQAVLKFRYAYTGISAVAPRWMTCASHVNGVLGFVTGAEFVKKMKSVTIKDKVSLHHKEFNNVSINPFFSGSEKKR